MVEDRINEWVLRKYGILPNEVRINIAITFELYYEKFTWWYAEIKTLEKYPTPPLFL
jgi:hypothetical protein